MTTFMETFTYQPGPYAVLLEIHGEPVRPAMYLKSSVVDDSTAVEMVLQWLKAGPPAPQKHIRVTLTWDGGGDAIEDARIVAMWGDGPTMMAKMPGRPLPAAVPTH